MEKDVNLSIAMALKQLFENRGFTVVMTRTTDCDLAPDNSKHPKTDDLTKRTALMSKAMWQSASVSIKTALRTVQAAVHRYSIMKPLMQEKSSHPLFLEL